VRERVYYVYILANRIGGTLYIGVTSDLVRRVYQHKEKLAKGFTAKYGVARLVYFEQFGEVVAAIRREKQLKRWNRAWRFASSRKRTRTGMISIPQLPSPEATGCPPSRA
jgi:putative endonuclease